MAILPKLKKLTKNPPVGDAKKAGNVGISPVDILLSNW